MAEIWPIEEIKPEKLANAIKLGLIFVYPTDTVYGLGCDATNQKAVKKLREIKGSQKPFSVIAPSLKWIKANFSIPQEFLSKLPGPYTIIAKPKNHNLVCEGVNLNSGSLGIRVPDHILTHLIQEAGRPFVTTSANITGERTITRINELEKGLVDKVDIIIDGGILGSKPSTIIDVRGKDPLIIRS